MEMAEELPFDLEKVIERARCHLAYVKSERIKNHLQQLLALLSQPHLHLPSLQKVAKLGLPYQFKELRVLIWMLCLNVLNTNKSDWNRQLSLYALDFQEGKKMFYQELVEKCHGLPIEKIKANPELAKDASLYEQIEKDCLRTYSQLSFFSKETVRRQLPFLSRNRREKVSNILNTKEPSKCIFVFDDLAMILYIVAKLQPDLSYSQGMNEVLGVLFYLVNHSQPYINSYIPYALFKAIGQRLRSYWQSDDKGIKNWLDTMQKNLKRYDPISESILHELDIVPAHYSIPWVVTLYAQSFELWKVIQLWDYLLSSRSIIEEVELTAIALVVLHKEVIQNRHYNEIMKRLQKLDEIELQNLIKKVEEVRISRSTDMLGGILDVFKGFKGFKVG